MQQVPRIQEDRSRTPRKVRFHRFANSLHRLFCSCCLLALVLMSQPNQSAPHLFVDSVVMTVSKLLSLFLQVALRFSTSICSNLLVRTGVTCFRCALWANPIPFFVQNCLHPRSPTLREGRVRAGCGGMSFCVLIPVLNIA